MELFRHSASEYFTYYFEFVSNDRSTSLTELLSSAARVNDKLRKETHSGYRQNLFSSDAFILIKMLRNHYEHNGDVPREILTLDAYATTNIQPDLGLCCLVPRDTIVSAKKGSQVNYEDLKLIDSVLPKVGDYYDIHPAIFNLSVHIFEKLEKLGQQLNTKEYLDIKKSYNKESLHNIDHYVKYTSYDKNILPDGSTIKAHLIAYNKKSHDLYEELPDYNLLNTVNDVPLLPHDVDFKIISENFISNVRSVDGSDFKKYNKEVIVFYELLNNDLLKPVCHLLNYDIKYVQRELLSIGADLETKYPDPTRLKLLNYNITAILTFCDKKYMLKNEVTFPFLVYMSIVINIKLLGVTDPVTKVMECIVGANKISDILLAIKKIQKNKKLFNLFKRLVYNQIAMLLIEYPFKDHVKLY